MTVVSMLNQKGGVGKTTLSIHLAAALAASHGGQNVLLVDADPQGSALDWSAQRAVEPLFRVVGLPKPTLHRDIPALGQNYAWTIIDGPPRVNDLARSAIAASDVVLIPVQPSPFDIWAAQDIIDIVNECLVHKPNLHVRFVLNRLFPNTTLGKEVKDALAGFDVRTMDSMVRNRTEYAKAAKSGLTALETEPGGQAAREIEALTGELCALLGAPMMEQAHVVNG